MTATQAPTPGPLTATDWRVGDFAARLEVHPLVKAGEIHRVTEMFRGGYLGFAPPVGGEWNPRGWGKCDADGWMPWSGGENPVPGQRVEVRLRNGRPPFTEPSNGLSWSHDANQVWSAHQITAFRLAPTAPVEASGSEREQVEHLARTLDKSPDEIRRALANLEAKGLIAIHPQPSGETREDAEVLAMLDDYADRHIGAPRGEDMSLEEMLISKARERLSARPLALGGQQGEGKRVRHKKRGTEYTIIGVGRAQGEISDEDPVVLYRGDTDGGLWVRHQAEFSDGRFEPVTTPARAEAQDEGAAGWIVGNSEDSRWRSWDQGSPVWVDDRARATRYARREDAEAVHAEDEDAWCVKPYPSPTPAADPVSIVPPHCTGMALSFEPGVLHVSKDGSGYIAIDEKHFELEDDRCEGPDGPEGSIHWITRLDASEVVALRDFLTGATPAADADKVRIAVAGLERIKAYRVCKESANIWTGATACRAIADETLAALKSTAAKEGGAA